MNRKRIVLGRTRKPRPDLHWDRNVLVVTDIGADGVTEVPLVARVDYNSNTGVSPSGVTLMRSIGMFQFWSTTLDSADVEVRIWWALAVTDIDDTGFNPGDGQDLTDERILAQGVLLVRNAFSTAAGFVQSMPAVAQFDCRQKVKLRDSNVSFFILNEAGAVRASGTMAALLKGDIT